MGPTNLALVKLFQADQKLREAQARLDAATRNVRVQERRVNDLAEKLKTAQSKLKEQQAHGANLDLDLKSRDAHIEKLRTQQQAAHNNKEYQAFLIEINTAKVDKAKIEEESLAVMEAVDKGQAENKEAGALLESEQAKLETLRSQITEMVAKLQAEVDALRPAREEAAKAVSPAAREAFDRLADRMDGEAMAALAKPNRRVEEYLCTACNMSLVTDIYNRLHTRDELVFCPSCRRILYIPEDLPPEAAVNKPKEKRTPKAKEVGASAPRQSSAADVLRSMAPEEDDDQQPEVST
jgi:uncharacterized protein